MPVGLLTIALALTKLREARDPSPGRLDWAGLITFSSALFLLIFGVLRGNGEGWSSPEIVGSLAVGAALLAAFAAIELRSRSPMLDLRLFRVPAFTGASIASFAVAASVFSMLLYVVLYLQNVLGHSRSRRDSGCSRSRPWPSSSRRLRPGSRNGFRCGR